MTGDDQPRAERRDGLPRPHRTAVALAVGVALVVVLVGGAPAVAAASAPGDARQAVGVTPASAPALADETGDNATGATTESTDSGITPVRHEFELLGNSMPPRDLDAAGTDDRERIERPWDAGLLDDRATVNVYSVYADGSEWCSGTLVDETHVLTAAHCVYNHSTEAWAEEVRVRPAADNRSGTVVEPFSRARARWVWTYEEYIASNGPTDEVRNDFALLALDRPIGNHTGTVDWQSYPSDAAVYRSGNNITAQGYPATPPGEPLFPTLWTDRGPGQGHYDGDEATMQANIEFSQGQSGGPFLNYDASTGTYELVGVGTVGPKKDGWLAPEPAGPRITERKDDDLESWIQNGSENPPADRPEYVFENVTFTGEERAWYDVTPAENVTGGLTNVTFEHTIRNVGTAAGPDEISVEVYVRDAGASYTDSCGNLIPLEDPIHTETVSAPDPFVATDVSVSTTLPEGTEPGEYATCLRIATGVDEFSIYPRNDESDVETLTVVEAPSLEVDVEHEDGTDASDVGALLAYQDGEVVEEVTAEDGIDLPYEFGRLDTGHTVVEVYSQGMFVGTVLADLAPGENASRTLTAPSLTPVEYQVYHEDGEVPLEGANVTVRSQGGDVVREGTTNGDGNVTFELQEQLEHDDGSYDADEFYDVSVAYEGEVVATDRIDTLGAEAESRTLVAPVPATVEACGTVDHGGSYDLVADLASAEATCLSIESDDVVLDGNGHTIKLWGEDVFTTDAGLDVAGSNVTVENLTLQGPTGERSGRGIDVGDSSDLTVADVGVAGFRYGVIGDAADEVRVRNATLENNERGLAASDVTALSVTDVYVANGSAGIIARASPRIENSTVRNTSSWGLYVDGSEAVVETTTVVDSWIEVYDGTIRDGTIHNTFVWVRGDGVAIENDTLTEGTSVTVNADDVRLAGNAISSPPNSASAIVVSDSANLTVAANVLKDVDDTAVEINHQSAGFLVRDNEFVAVEQAVSIGGDGTTDGRVEGNTVRDSTFGVQIIAPNQTVAGNTMTNVSQGVSGFGENVTLRNNTIAGADPGIQIEGRSVTVERNVIEDGGDGIRGWGATDLRFVDNHLRDLDGTAVSLVDATNVTLEGTAIETTAGDDVHVENTTGVRGRSVRLETGTVSFTGEEFTLNAVTPAVSPDDEVVRTGSYVAVDVPAWSDESDAWIDLRVSYQEGAVPAADEADLRLWRLDDEQNEWNPIANSTVDTTDRYVAANVQPPAVVGPMAGDAPGLTDYANETGVVGTDGLRDAVDDWRAGALDTPLLRDVVDYWRSGEPVE
jgi:V8-like Glu-specific endopeptidase